MRADRIETAYPIRFFSATSRAIGRRCPPDFMLFLDSMLNLAESEERGDWIFVFDFATIHRAEEFRAKVPNQIHIVYIPAQATSYCQPFDMAMFEAWKSVVADAANESLAETIMTGQNIKTAFGFSLKHLKKKRTVTWAEKSTLAT